MSLKITATDTVSFSLCEKDRETSIIQNVFIILNTWQGTIPFYRPFGVSSKCMHKPTPVAKSMLCASVQEAVEEYEPRVSVIAVTFDEDPDMPGNLIPTVEVEFKDE